jgi:hypothetical protein
LSDGVTKRRLGHAKFCRRFGEAPFLSDGDERQQVIKVSALH